jgi:hypothetical protein
MLTPCLIPTLPAFTDEHVQLVNKLCLKNLGANFIWEI